MGKLKIDTKVIKILAKRFLLTFEQAETLYLAYHIGGSCEESVEAVYTAFETEMYGIGKGVIRQVFEALHDLYYNPKYREDMNSGERHPE